MPPKQKQPSYEDKKRLIAAKDAGKSTADLMKQFDLAKSTVNNVISKRESILSKVEEGIDSKTKRFKVSDTQLDDAVLSWFKTQQSNNTPINGPLIQAKAIELAEELGNDEFKASDIWLTSFKKPHGITFKVKKAQLTLVDKLEEELESIRSKRSIQPKIISFFK